MSIRIYLGFCQTAKENLSRKNNKKKRGKRSLKSNTFRRGHQILELTRSRAIPCSATGAYGQITSIHHLWHSRDITHSFGHTICLPPERNQNSWGAKSREVTHAQDSVENTICPSVSLPHRSPHQNGKVQHWNPNFGNQFPLSVIAVLLESRARVTWGLYLPETQNWDWSSKQSKKLK